MVSREKTKRMYRSSLIIFIGLALILLGIGLSISLGAKEIGLGTVFQSIFSRGEDMEAIIVYSVRLPRAVAAVLVGGFLAVSGAMMQGITRNPIADPSIIGVTQGAILTMAITTSFGFGFDGGERMVVAFLGAGFSGLFVSFLSARGQRGMDPMKLALAGVALGTLFTAITTGLAMYFQLGEQLGFWLAGGLVNVTWNSVMLLGVVGGIALIIGMILSPSITLLSLGEEVAVGLGGNTNMVRMIGIGVVILLSGSAVSVAGNIAFLGLIVPQILKNMIGVDYRYLIPCSFVVGGALLVYSDIVARMVNAPYETPIGTLIALIGVPIFIYLVRRGSHE